MPKQSDENAILAAQCRQALADAISATARARQRHTSASENAAEVQRLMGQGGMDPARVTESTALLAIAEAELADAIKWEDLKRSQLVNEDVRLATALVPVMADALALDIPITVEAKAKRVIPKVPKTLPSCVIVQTEATHSHRGQGYLYSHLSNKLGRERIVAAYVFFEPGRFVSPPEEVVIRAATAHDVNLGQSRPGHTAVQIETKVIDGVAVTVYSFTITCAYEDRPVIDTTSPFYVAEPKITLPITDALTPPGLYNTVSHARTETTLLDETVIGRVRTVTLKLTASAVCAFTPEDTRVRLQRLVEDQRRRARPYLGRAVKLDIDHAELTDQWGNRPVVGRPAAELAGASVGALITYESATG